MSARIRHVFGGRSGSGMPELHERICRPGAVFGPSNVELAMGVRTVYHEHAERRRRGKTVCPVCSMESP